MAAPVAQSLQSLNALFKYFEIDFLIRLLVIVRGESGEPCTSANEVDNIVEPRVDVLDIAFQVNNVILLRLRETLLQLHQSAHVLHLIVTCFEKAVELVDLLLEAIYLLARLAHSFELYFEEGHIGCSVSLVKECLLGASGSVGRTT